MFFSFSASECMLKRIISNEFSTKKSQRQGESLFNFIGCFRTGAIFFKTYPKATFQRSSTLKKFMHMVVFYNRNFRQGKAKARKIIEIVKVIENFDAAAQGH